MNIVEEENSNRQNKTFATEQGNILANNQKGDYNVPEFLSYLVKNDIPDAEFVSAYSSKSANDTNTPLFWTREISFNVSKKEVKKSIIKEVALNFEIKKDTTNIITQNLATSKSIYEQSFLRNKLSQFKELAEIKQEQLCLFTENELAKKDKEILNLTLELQKAKEEQLLLKENIKFFELQVERLKTYSFGLQKVVLEEKVDINLTDIAPNLFTKVNIEDNFITPPEKNEINQESIETLKEVIEKPLQFKQARTYLPPNPNNVLEIVDFTLHNKLRETNIISNFNCNVYKKGVSIIYSQNEDKLAHILHAVTRTYGTHFSIAQGEIRIAGLSNTSVLKQDFGQNFGGFINSYNDLKDIVNRSTGSANSIIRESKIATDKLNIYLDIFGLNIKHLNIKLHKAELEIRNKILFVLFFISSKLINIIYLLNEDATEFVTNQQIITALQTHSKDQSILLLTDNINLIGNLPLSKLFSL